MVGKVDNAYVSKTYTVGVSLHPCQPQTDISQERHREAKQLLEGCTVRQKQNGPGNIVKLVQRLVFATGPEGERR